MSTLRVDNLNARTGSTITVPTGNKLYAPGAVIQVVYARSNVKASTTSATPTAIDSTLNLVITPTTANSKIFVAYHPMFSGSLSAYNNYAYIYRNSTQLTYTNCYRVDYQNQYETIRPSLIYLDSPATTASITYALYCSVSSSSYNLQYNYASADNGDWGYSYGYAMEIGA